MSTDEENRIEAELGWLPMGKRLFVNVDDLIALLRAGDYTELADDFERIAADERAQLAGPLV